MNLSDGLYDHLSTFASPPYLFVGSGMSRRYLGLPDWKGLLEQQCSEHGLNFGMLSADADGNLPLIASAMAKELNPKWWNDDKYADSRDQYKNIATSKDSALKIEIAKFISMASMSAPAPSADLAAEIELFKKIVVDGIVTTNWDDFLESMFPDDKVYIGQEALLFSQIQGIKEIYKIHGSAEEPSSLILTELDYEQYRNANPYLASKLLTFFVENPIVFLGYSLTDPNIQDILHSVLACLSQPNVEKLADRLIFVRWDKNSTEDRLERNILTIDGRSLPVLQATTSNLAGALEALGKIKRRLPTKILRSLKEQVYSLIHTLAPTDKLVVQDIDDDTDIEDIEFAIGVGIREKLLDKGYTAIGRSDLMRDVLTNEGGLLALQVVRGSLPELLKKSVYTPVFKYLAAAEGSPGFDAAALDARIKIASKRTLADLRPPKLPTTMNAVSNWKTDFKAFSEQYPIKQVLLYAAYLPAKALVVEQLQAFLIANLALLDVVPNTNFCKMVCIYDYARYAKLPKATLTSKKQP